MTNSDDKTASASEAESSGADAPLSPAEREEARLHEPDVATAVAEAARRSGAQEAQKAKRPPLWLMAFTLAIPLAIGWVWYQSSNSRPLTCAEIDAKLAGGNAAEHRHGLEWVGKRIDDFSKQKKEAEDALRKNPDAKVVVPDEEEVVPCAKTVIEYLDTTPPEPQLYNDLCRALGSFHMLGNQDFKSRAFNYLFDVIDRSHIAGQQKTARYQAATSLARFGRAFLIQRQVLQVVQAEVGQMLEENDELMTSNGAWAMGMIGSSTHVQRLQSLANQTSSPDVKMIALEAARLCKERVD